ncbi:MAG: 3-methyl-2-oxobutanoate hydroxymethyltransferase [Candidatus Anammoximicrobium sp.]|nr:3-methyl-2-oxobutanoate hydroxymethyltransferase [Candidatus Anammoximicrobium sp.]
MANQTERTTVPAFRAMKGQGRKIAVLTAYDYPTARLLDEAGVDVILVGDSLSMVVQGRETTLPVTLEEMVYHAEIVGRAVQRALVVVDLPFPTAYVGVHKAVEAAARILKAARCQAVKLEGGAEQAEVIAALVSAGIPVMGHVGLRPQNVHQMGGYKVQRDEQRLKQDARCAEQAGAFGLVLECVPAPLAAEITQTLGIPTIGIGAGPECDGQVLVIHDLLGVTQDPMPRFVKKYANLHEVVSQAVRQYCDEVRTGVFPASQHAFK